MEYKSNVQFRVFYRNRLVEKVKKLIEEEQQNWYEIEMMKVFEDLLEVENVGFMYKTTNKCEVELQDMKNHMEELKKNIGFYHRAILRTFEEIRILDEKMIPDELKTGLHPLPHYPYK